jgi:hypothetical protein
MKTLFSLIWTCVFLLCFACSEENKMKPGEVTCPGGIIGNPKDPPSITITSASNEPGSRQVEGTANNIDTKKIRVVLWAKTDMWYVQPLIASPYTDVCSDGSWENWTHQWDRLVALLADETYEPKATRRYHPGSDPGVLTWDEWPKQETDRVLDFGGRRWRIKVSKETKAGPGPNYFSNTDENVWVDDAGLHLRITLNENKWYCAEVVLQDSLGYGKYTFQLSSSAAGLDPHSVFAGFIYESDSSEVDIEFSQELASPFNAQYVVQPWSQNGNRHCFFMPDLEKTSHRFVWSASSLHFSSLSGHGPFPPESNDILEEWIYTGENIPRPGNVRMRFNLWLYGGRSPVGGQGDEVVIRSFAFNP